jgi:hypothetical protein
VLPFQCEANSKAFFCACVVVVVVFFVVVVVVVVIDVVGDYCSFLSECLLAPPLLAGLHKHAFFFILDTGEKLYGNCVALRSN